jgi:arabinofuranan 3-O-arabinosyltransferase
VSSRAITIACALVVLFYAAILGMQVGKSKGWPIDDLGRPTQTDYVALWGAGRLALEGRPAAAYDWEAHRKAMAEGLGRVPKAFPFPYPPTFLALIAPFATLPYIPSLLLWGFITLGLYVAAMARVIGRAEGAIWMAAPILTLANFNVGQNGFLTASLLATGLVLLNKRPLAAGVLIGAMSIKPHLGLLIPLALAAGGLWRAFWSAAATVVALAALTLTFWGLEPWSAFIANLGTFGASIVSDQYYVPYKLQSAYGFLHTVGLPRSAALALHCALALAIAGAVIWAWTSRAAFELKAALLAVGTVLVSPYVFIYDLTMLVVAQAFIIAHGLRVGFGRWDAIMLTAVNALLVMFVGVKLPTGFLASIVLACWLMVRAWPALAAMPSSWTASAAGDAPSPG